MHTGMIVISSFPPDIRIEKECRTLIEKGHKVSLLCLARDSLEIREEVFSGIHIHRVCPKDSYGAKWRARIGARTYRLNFHDFFWSYKIEQFVIKTKPDVLHLHDLAIARDALSVSRKYKIPFVLDLHENYPANIESTASDLGMGIISRLFVYNVRRWYGYEKWATERSDAVITTVQEAKKRIVQSYHLPEEKVYVVPNTEDPEIFLNEELEEDVIEKDEKEIIIGYIGSLSPHRGLDTMIDALALLRQADTRFRLIIIGKGFAIDSLKKRAKIKGVSGSVQFLPWQPFSKVPSFINAMDIGVVPHHKNEQTEQTVPHKLFQYMLLSKPVLVSSCKPLKRIVEETEAGCVFEAGDAKDAAEALRKLSDPHLRKTFGERGRQASMNNYNWNVTSLELLRLYDSL